MFRVMWKVNSAMLAGSSAVLLLTTVLFLPRHADAAMPTKTCLTGTAAEVANDPAQIQDVREWIDEVCACGAYDGSKGKTHSNYVQCAAQILTARIQAQALRAQCKATVKAYYAKATCGTSANLHAEPCIQTSLKTGKITCAIKPTTKKDGVAPSMACLSTADFTRVWCPEFTQCIAAADTDQNGIIAPPDSGNCAVVPTPTPVPTDTVTYTPQSTATATATATPTSVCGTKTDGMTCDAGTDGPQALICVSGACVACTVDTNASPRLVDNGDGTITDRSTCLVWEKKDLHLNADQSIGQHHVEGSYRWAGYCTGNTGKNCQPDAASSAACGASFGCAQCGAGEGTCTGAFTNQTVFQWLNIINAASFAGHGDWRLPKEQGRSGAGGPNELETILAAPYNCTVGPPCVDPPFNTNCGTDNNNYGCTIDGAGATQECSCSNVSDYWSGTGSGGAAWIVLFNSGFPATVNQLYNFQARAVRGGL